MNRRAALLTLVMTVMAATAALPVSAVPVTFQVRMGYQIELGSFDPGSDFVDVAGSFNGWGSDPLTPLTDTDGDSIYEITIDGFDESDYIEFKFRINGQWDGTEEFPGVGNNRSYTVLASGNGILVWYNDLEPGGGGIGDLHWWNDSVFYEIFVRSFFDSDGDGIGDFQGLTQKLDYLNDGDPETTGDLGITGIWLMPIHDSPTYHGYDAVDYYSINPDYGTMADFEAFLAAAHARGIRVIMDFVMNHCSNQHPWFTASEQGDPQYRDYFRWEQSDPGQTGPWGQDVWHWNPSGWYYGLFWSGMPDLNYGTQAVRDEMFATATYWLDTVGVDGFRLDAVLYVLEEGDQLQNTDSTLQFWADFNAHVKSVKADAFSVGEAWTATSIVLQYVTRDRLDFCFEFDLSYAIMGAVNDGDAGWVSTKAGQVYSLYPYLQFGTFLTNHDQDRALSVLGYDEDKARAAAGIYLTMPGIPFVYYGEEIGMTGSGAHENIRTPMQWTDGSDAGFTTGTPWEPVNSNYEQYNVTVEDQDAGSLLSWYRKMIGVRNAAEALRRGTHVSLASSVSPVLAYLREYGQEKVLCIVNTASNPLGSITLTGSSSSLVPGDQRLENLLVAGDTLDITVDPEYGISGIDLAGYEVAVYRFVTGTVTGTGD
ncbi:MAG TPA: alpha-amylase family glycosyl hydrolase, partial [Candidatus Krumholzibacterium sp.]|nr:alpha-amylase family glycosyl hydrolase [Candidatus Krumholzibacterium sp.]